MSIAAAGMNVANTLPKQGLDSVKPSRDVLTIEKGDATEFREAMQRHMSNGGAEKAPLHDKNKVSMGDQMLERAGKISESVKTDQQHITKLLETATATGDSMKLMQAMMAMNDYQMNVQVISKCVSKAASSVDQLTKLQ